MSKAWVHMGIWNLPAAQTDQTKFFSPICLKADYTD
jgi:hypothetical protein